MQIAIIDGKNPPKPLVDAAKKSQFEWGERLGQYLIYPCHAGQLDILRSKAKVTIALAGAQGGKSATISLWLHKLIQKNKGGGKYLLVSPTNKMLNQSGLVSMLKQAFDEVLGGKWYIQQSVYRWATGEIYVRTSENPETLDGGVYDGAVLDEAAKMSEDVKRRIEARCAAKDAPILCVSTPDLDSFLIDYEAQTLPINGNEDKRASADGSIFLRRWKSIDRPGFSVKAFEQARATSNPAWFARMYEGKYQSLEGLCYTCFQDERSPLYPVIKSNPDKLPSPPVRFFSGNDWGYSPDPAAHLIFAECENGVIYCLEEIYGTEITPDEYARRVRALIDKWALKQDHKYSALISGGSYAACWTDTSRPEHNAMFKRVGIPIKGKKVEDIGAGIAIVDSWFRAGRLKIYQTCENTIRELKTYQWDTDRRGIIKDKPKGKNDHTCFPAGTMITTSKGDIAIENVRERMLVLTRKGYRKVLRSMKTAEYANTLTLTASDGRTVTATPDHPFYVKGKGFIPLDAVSNGDEFVFTENQWNRKLLNTTEYAIDGIPTPKGDQTGCTTKQLDTGICIGGYGKINTAQSRQSTISTIATAIRLTTISPTWNYCPANSIYLCMGQQISNEQGRNKQCLLQWNRRRNGTDQRKEGLGIANTGSEHGSEGSSLINYARYVKARSQPEIQNSLDSAPIIARQRIFASSIKANAILQPVYNLTVEGEHEYFANGILVSNCDALRYAISSQKYGVSPEPLEVQVTPEQVEQQTSQKIERYGLDEQALKDQEAQNAKQRYIEWFNRVINLEPGI